MKALILSLLIVSSVGFASEERALIAYMKVKPGAERTFLDAARAVINDSRHESGNLIYELHQSVTNPQQFVFYELYKTGADLKAHRDSRHVKAFLSEVDPIVEPGQFILEEYQEVLRNGA